MKPSKRTLVALAPLLLVPVAAALAPNLTPGLPTEETWVPWRFTGNETYELRMINHSQVDQTAIGMTLDISPADAGEGGAEQVVVSYTTRVSMPASKLGPQSVFTAAAGAGMGMGPAMLMVNPMVSGFMKEMKLAVGEKMALFGAGRIEVVGREEIAGMEGYVCKYFGPKDQGEPVMFEWVVHPELAMPLKSINYDRGGKKTWEIQVVSYEKR